MARREPRRRAGAQERLRSLPLENWGTSRLMEKIASIQAMPRCLPARVVKACIVGGSQPLNSFSFFGVGGSIDPN